MLTETEVKRRVKFEAKRRDALATLPPSVEMANHLIEGYTNARLTVETDDAGSPVRISLRDRRRVVAVIDYQLRAFETRPSALQVTGAHLASMPFQESRLINELARRIDRGLISRGLVGQHGKRGPSELARTLARTAVQRLQQSLITGQPFDNADAFGRQTFRLHLVTSWCVVFPVPKG